MDGCYLIDEVDTAAPMLKFTDISEGRTFKSDGHAVKFSADIGTLTAAGSKDWNITLKVNDAGSADEIVINIKGIEEPVRVVLDAKNVNAYRIGEGQWFLGAPETEDILI